MAQTTFSLRNLIAATPASEHVAACAADDRTADAGLMGAIDGAGHAQQPGAGRATLQSNRVSRRKSLGQGMTEYIVIVALVGVAAIGVYSFLGQSVRGATAGIALEISGKSGKAGTDIARDASDKAVNTANRKTSLGNYHEGNNH